jgi:hypothetical protein
MTSIVLTRPHTHAGKSLTAGERLDVERNTADWLIANGIARHDREPVSLSTSTLLPPEGDGKPLQHKATTRKESKP